MINTNPNPAQRGPTFPAAVAPIDSHDLHVRISLAMPQDTAKGMFFNGAIAAFKLWLGDAATLVTRPSGGEKKYVDFFNYPIADFLRLSFAGVNLASVQKGGFEATFRALGRQSVNDFLVTTVGKMLLVLAGKEPKRLLSAAAGAYKTCVSYGERQVTFSGERRCTLVMRRDFMPHPYHEGVLLQVLEAQGVGNPQVQGQRLGPVDAKYEISWE